MSTPLVSVNMCVWRPHEVYFPQAVRSILDQTFEDFELIIVEDPSEIDGRAMIADLLGDPRIRYVQNAARTGLLSQKNKALALSRGQYIAILDQDDVALPDRLERQARFLDTEPLIHAVGTWISAIDSAGRHLGVRRYPTDPASVRSALRRFSPIAHPSVMFRRSTVSSLGGYTWCSADDPHGLVSDYDLWCRMALAGFDMANIPEVLLQYRIHSLAQKRAATKRFLRATLEIKRRYLIREFGFVDWLRYLGEHCLLLLPSGLIWATFIFLTYRPTRAKLARNSKCNNCDGPER